MGTCRRLDGGTNEHRARPGAGPYRGGAGSAGAGEGTV